LQAERVAGVLEGYIYGESMNKTGYSGRARSLLVHITGAASAAALLHHSEDGLRAPLAQLAASDVAASGPAVLQRLCDDLEIASDVGTLCECLQRLEGVPVTAEMLRQEPAVRRVKAFSKHTQPCVAAAAKAVIAVWKACCLRAAQSN